MSGNASFTAFKCNFQILIAEENSNIRFCGGSVEERLRLRGNTGLTVIDGTFFSGTHEGFYLTFQQLGFKGNLNVCGGSFYFDPTNYLDTNTYKATKTKDADNVDIWVVTEK